MRMRVCIAVIIALAGACSDSNVSREIGARCDSSDECDQRCLVESEGYPGGFCTLVCDTSDVCPPGSECTERSGGACLFNCSGDGDCTYLGAGWRCQDVDRRGPPGGKVKVCRGG